MKITQRMIDQARMIAEAKVGQQLQESWEFGNGWNDLVDNTVSFDDGHYEYRIKPEVIK